MVVIRAQFKIVIMKELVMKQTNKLTLGKLAALFALGLGLSSTATYAAESPQYRVINLRADVTRQVQNDEMYATLYTEFNEKDPTVLANKLSASSNKALAQAKSYPSVSVTTGNHNTYPVYDDKERLTHWRGRSEIHLKSQDFKATSELVAKLQSDLKMDRIQFGVSQQQQQKIENELYVEASKAFQQRAQTLLAPWNAQSYELVNLSLDPHNAYMLQGMIGSARGAYKNSDMVENQNYEAGNSELKVTASGSIQLR